MIFLQNLFVPTLEPDELLDASELLCGGSALVGSNQAPATKIAFSFSDFREPRNHPN